jgi:alpha-tubulin suppressor-like RCC1 family protein
MKCWGHNGFGQLGSGDPDTDQPQPVDVVGLDESEVVAITAGGEHTCAVLDSGVARCWGHDDYGQLGDGPDWKSTPVDVVGLPGFDTP